MFTVPLWAPPFDKRRPHSTGLLVCLKWRLRVLVIDLTPNSPVKEKKNIAL